MAPGPACLAARSRTRLSSSMGISRFLSPAFFDGWCGNMAMRSRLRHLSEQQGQHA